MASLISQIPVVDIEPNGVCKYILVNLTAKVPGGKEDSVVLVRGYSQCNYHADINDKLTDDLQKLKQSGELEAWKTKVLGGGRIIHDSPNKTIKVYGYSQAYGKADHEVTVNLLRELYEDYNISWSDEGY